MTQYRSRRRMRLGKDLLLTACFLGLLTLIAARLSGSEPREILVGPFNAVDGDTLTKAGHRLRLTGIDAPELDQTCGDANGQSWPCGRAAREALAKLMQDHEMQCEGSQTDRYHRLLVTCYGNGQNVNAAMVRAGMALSTSLLTYRREQHQAEIDRRGIWIGAFENPRAWRDRKRIENDAAASEGMWGAVTEILSLRWL
ncbi:thermonuclease family protein [Rhizobium helianthi]|uniref:Thermonuclease family protein n=1 Tax=Rhizobium helianthi TaxID=1132695 RepID=A0ABW4LZV7_9HYPH